MWSVEIIVRDVNDDRVAELRTPGRDYLTALQRAAQHVGILVNSEEEDRRNAETATD